MAMRHVTNGHGLISRSQIDVRITNFYRAFVKPRAAVLFVLALAFGSGPIIALFSHAEAVILRPFPYLDSKGVVRIWESSPARGLPAVKASTASYFAWRQSASIDQLAASMLLSDGVVATLAGQSRRLEASGITSNFLDLLRARPLLGRGFIPGQEAQGQTEALISYVLWRSVFGADPSVIGQKIVEERGASYTIVGVLPEGFRLPHKSDIWLQLYLHPQQAQQRTTRALEVWGRLKDGTDLTLARRDLATVSERLAREFPGTNKDWGVRVLPLEEALTLHLRPMLAVLVAAATGVWLIAVSNVLGLALLRDLRRRKDFAIRSALGATTGRLLRDSAIEGATLGFMGGLGGAALGFWTAELLGRWAPPELAAGQHVGWSTLAWTVLVCSLVGSCCSITGTLAMRRAGGWRGSAFSSGFQESFAPRKLNATLRLVAGGAVTITFVLTLAALLLLQNYRVRVSEDLGMNVAGLWVIDGRFPFMQVESRAARYIELSNEVLPEVRALPGVSGVSIASALPVEPPMDRLRTFARATIASALQGTGASAEDEASAGVSPVYHIGPGYFGVMGSELLAGRDVLPSDIITRPDDLERVVIVNEWTARWLWPRESAVGKYVSISPDRATARRVVGVVRDRQWHVDTTVGPALYLPYVDAFPASPLIVIRASDEAARMAGDVIRRSPSPLIVDRVRRVSDVVREKLARPRYTTVLTGMLALEATILAFLGVYGATTYASRTRRREMAVRLATGATPGHVRGLILRDAALLAGAGVAAGLAMYAALARVVGALLYEVEQMDGRTIAGASVIVATMVLLATARAVRDVGRIDLATMLKHE